MASGTKRARGEDGVPPPVGVVEVAAVVDHAEGVVEGRVDQPAARAIRGHALQALCTCRTHTESVREREKEKVFSRFIKKPKTKHF